MIKYISIVLLFTVFYSCADKKLADQDMIDLLRKAELNEDDARNVFSTDAIIRMCDSVIRSGSSPDIIAQAWTNKANALLQAGEEQKAIDIFEKVLSQTPRFEFEQRTELMKSLAVSYMRLGERTNCINNHGAESCIFPLSIAAIHTDKTGSEKAIELYKQILTENPSDLESKWLLNIAYMTTGEYPDHVPPQFLLQVKNDDSLHLIKPFTDVAANMGLNIRDMSGGSIVDDFNNDGYLDLIFSSWSLSDRIHYCRNNGDGTFTDASDSSHLGYLAGGLNMMQVDYNNDGWKDIFVLRGAWKMQFGKVPNSLLRNNGDGTFTDVTKESGMLSFHPTQAATWADFNNDGWLDLFIGNESEPNKEPHPCELYINNINGTFTNKAHDAGCEIVSFVKGVTSGDYNNDGLTDIFVSTMNGTKMLLKNISTDKAAVKFSDVTVQAGILNNTRTFPTWFWDYDNDGWLDILVCSYEFYQSLSNYAAAEAVNGTTGYSGKVFLYHNKHDGTFEDVSLAAGLTKVAFAMGANFGDIDNDGYLDFYLGTGNPQLRSLVPNKLFKNIDGKHFLDVTTSARVGNLQKGHGVSFADLDNDGDEDIYIEMGGAYKGDAYESSLYLNPGQNSNNWINISLEGVASNRSGVGSRIRVSFKENGKERSVYRDVNSGGSFGSNPLRQHIGVGSAQAIDSIVIYWPATGKTQVLKDIAVNKNIRIKEGSSAFDEYKLSLIDFKKINSALISCAPAKK